MSQTTSLGVAVAVAETGPADAVAVIPCHTPRSTHNQVDTLTVRFEAAGDMPTMAAGN
jgi:hypothetical protein